MKRAFNEQIKRLARPQLIGLGEDRGACKENARKQIEELYYYNSRIRGSFKGERPLEEEEK